MSQVRDLGLDAVIWAWIMAVMSVGTCKIYTKAKESMMRGQGSCPGFISGDQGS